MRREPSCLLAATPAASGCHRSNAANSRPFPTPLAIFATLFFFLSQV